MTTWTIAGQDYTTDADGFSAELDCWILRNADGRIVTIPAA